jgi:hypothetical protein
MHVACQFVSSEKGASNHCIQRSRGDLVARPDSTAIIANDHRSADTTFHRRWGFKAQAKNAIENQLEEMISQGRSIQKQVGKYLFGTASQVGEGCEEGYDLAAQQLADGYKLGSRYAKENPSAAVDILFGSGVLAGLGMAMLMRRR